MKKLIVSCAYGSRYSPLIGRLLQACDQHEPHTAVVAWVNEYPPGSPTHQQSHYSFKGYALKNAVENEQPDLLLWMDAACYPIRSLDILWEKIAADGYYMQANGFNLGQWSSDVALRNFGITREQAWQIPEISGMVYGIDLRKHADWVAEFYQFSADGSTNGVIEMNDIGPGKAIGCWQPERGVGRVSEDPRVIGHRTDQTIATYLAWKRGWVLTPRPEYVEYKTQWERHHHARTVILNHGGMT